MAKKARFLLPGHGRVTGQYTGAAADFVTVSLNGKHGTATVSLVGWARTVKADDTVLPGVLIYVPGVDASRAKDIFRVSRAAATAGRHRKPARKKGA